VAGEGEAMVGSKLAGSQTVGAAIKATRQLVTRRLADSGNAHRHPKLVAYAFERCHNGLTGCFIRQRCRAANDRRVESKAYADRDKVDQFPSIWLSRSFPRTQRLVGLHSKRPLSSFAPAATRQRSVRVSATLTRWPRHADFMALNSALPHVSPSIPVMETRMKVGMLATEFVRRTIN
jgi:hypothetical protein